MPQTAASDVPCEESLKYSCSSEVRALLWDFDGTLADTLRQALDVYNRLAPDYGFRAIDDPQLARGMTMRQFMKFHGVPTWCVPALFLEFLKSIKQTNIPQLFPGMADVLRQLCNGGYRQGVVSSNATETIRTCVREHGVEDVFDIVAGILRLFGKQRRLRQAVRELNAAPENCLYIGDEVRDIEAAAACGIAAASVTWGLNTREILEKHDPVFLVDSVSDLPALVDAHFAARRRHSR